MVLAAVKGITSAGVILNTTADISGKPLSRIT
jgi:hypothetical protein